MSLIRVSGARMDPLQEHLDDGISGAIVHEHEWRARLDTWDRMHEQPEGGVTREGGDRMHEQTEGGVTRKGETGCANNQKVE